MMSVDALVAQLDRAFPSGGKGQEFESPRAHQILSSNERGKWNRGTA